MSLSHENVGLKILGKIKIYVLTRAELLFKVCYEIPCMTEWTCMLDFFIHVRETWEKEYLRWRCSLLVERSSWAHLHLEYIWIFRNCPDTIWWQKVSHPPGWRYNWIEYCGLLEQCQGCTLSSLSSHWQELQREIYSKMNLQGSHWPQCLLFSTTFKIG